MVNAEKQNLVLETVSKQALKDANIKYVCEVSQTQAYGLFRYLPGNRPLDLLNLKHIVESATEEWLINPIIVNEKFEIVEGQHRFEAAKTLNLPVYFIQISGYGLKQTFTLNTIGKKWDALNFADSYAKKGNQHYQTFLDFKKKYGFDTRGVLQVLAYNITNKKYGFTFHQFAKGQFEIVDEDGAIMVADRIKQIGLEYHPDVYTKRSYISAYIRLMSHKLYNHEDYLKNLEKRPYPVYHYPNSGMYLDVFTKIYNYDKKHNRISF
jgi:hypothetical protein